MRVKGEDAMIRTIWLLTLAATPMVLSACAHVKVDPIEVKPIHIVHDINIRVDRQLDEFFAFEAQKATTQPAAPATAPTATIAH
jgi:hypothetical protein